MTSGLRASPWLRIPLITASPGPKPRFHELEQRRERAARRVPRKRDPAKTPEPFVERGRRRRGCRSFVVQRHAPAGSTTTSGSSATARSPRGRCRRGSRSSPARVRSPSTSRTTRSTTRPSRARSRRASTAPARSRSGTRGTYELVEEKRDGGLTVRLHGERLEGTWTLVPAKLDGDEKNWLLVRKRGRGRGCASATTTGRCSRRPPRGCRRATGWAVRDQVGRLPRARLRPRRRREARSAATATTSPAASRAVARALAAGGAQPGVRRRRRGVRARRARAARASPRCSRASRHARSSTTVFDVLEIDGEPVVELPLEERRRRLERLLDPRRKRRAAVGGVRRRRGAPRGGDGAGPRGRDGEEARLALRRGQADARLAEDQDPRPAGVRHLRLDARAGPPRGRASARSCSACSATASSLGRQLRHRLHASATSTSCLRSSEPLRRDASPFAAVPKMPKVRKGDVTWVEPRLVCEVEFAEWTHDGHLRAPHVPGAARRQAGRRGRPRGRRTSASSRTSTRCSGRTRGSRRATSSTTTARSRPCSSRTCAGGRSRCAAIPTGRSARRSSRRTRRRTCRSGSRASTPTSSTPPS